MTLSQFTVLDKAGQQDVLLKEGLKLGERIQPDVKYEFYQLDNFYVELKIRIPEEGGLLGLQTFEKIDQLEPYLQLMNIKTEGLNE